MNILLPLLLLIASADQSSATGSTQAGPPQAQPQIICCDPGDGEPEDARPTVQMTSPAGNPTVGVPGSFVVSANAWDDSAVVQVEFFANGNSIGIDTTAPYSVVHSGLAAGDYSYTAKAMDDQGQLSVGTASLYGHVAVGANQAPTVSLTSPTNGQTSGSPGTFVLNATAQDGDGTIATVQFKSGSTVLCTDNAAPFSCTASGLAIGNYSFSAVATDDDGAVATSNVVAVSVTANYPPTVALTSPLNGDMGVPTDRFVLNANASDTDGTIVSVKFYSNGVLIATDTTKPYAAIYSPAVGTYVLTAVATDSANSTATSAGVTITALPAGYVYETRRYVYDEFERLCKTIDPESGSTVIHYDGAGNVDWTADGLNLPSTTSCDSNSQLISATTNKTSRSYDKMNRVLAVTTPGNTANVVTTYEPDGQVATLTAANPGGNNVVTTYSYNKRRLLTSEKQENGQVVFLVSYGYDANGHLNAISYPDDDPTHPQVVDYSLDALGRATQVSARGGQVYASGVTYYPNGAIAGFRYGPASGGGPVHAMSQNARLLPQTSSDVVGSTRLLHDTYEYDENGNVTDITDGTLGGAYTRGMGYDKLDRLTAAVGPWGNATYGYDALDNLRSADQGTRQFRYNYDATWRLASIKNPAGGTLYSFTHDADGNMLSKKAGTSTQRFVFDGANRMSSADVAPGGVGAQGYRYDGLGRRVQTTDPDLRPTYWLYSKAGQVLYSTEARRQQNISYIYLGGSQIATRTWAFGTGAEAVRFQMTDALGSPVVSTNTSGSSSSRVSYTPWGESTPAVDGTGYTGHVMDAGTGLIYMQQRYYDPTISRFTSVDPVSAGTGDMSNFNAYEYGDSSPFSNVDPDGRSPSGATGFCGVTGCDGGTWRAAEDRVIAALEKDGVQVFRQVAVSTTQADGKVVTAVADYAYRLGDQIHFGEVKDGLHSKFTSNQKVVYAAIKSGSVRIVNSRVASALGVVANRSLGSNAARLSIHAMEGGRAWRQAARYFPGAGKVLGVLASTPVLVIDLLTATEQISAYGRLTDECPQCKPAATYSLGR